MKFRKKPVVVDAWLFDGSYESYAAIPSGGMVRWFSAGPSGRPPCVEIQTLEGTMTAWGGDWIIKGVKGEFYSCKSDIFPMTYEPEGEVGAVPPAVSPNLEICVCAAILADGEIVRGHRHDDAILTARKMGLNPRDAEQGFVTSRNRFVGRMEGANLQRAAGIPSAQTGVDLPSGCLLFSEDLYLRGKPAPVASPVSPLPPQGWQTIETAPKDEFSLMFEWFDMFEDPNRFVPRIFIGMWWKGDNLNRADWTDTSQHYARPTHWMPLPDPPSASPLPPQETK